MEVHIEEFAERRDRASFDCEVEPLNDFLRRFARQNQEKGLSRTFVAVEKARQRKILGYSSVSMGQVAFESLPPEKKKGLPKYPIPIMRIGRLAVDKSVQGQGIGGHLLMDALYRAVEVSESIGIFAVVIDAKDERAKSFYEKYGFIPFQDNSLALFIPLSTIPRDESSVPRPKQALIDYRALP